MTDKPEKPSDPRPGDEPYYIDNECENCGSELVLFDEDSGWNDEWECPDCQDGIYLDVPESYIEELKERAASEESVPFDEVEQEFRERE